MGGISRKSNENALMVLANLISFFDGDSINFNDSCFKTPIIAILENIQKNLSSNDTCTVETFFEGPVVIRTHYHIECIDKETGMKISFSWIDEGIADLKKHNQSKIYKGKYSIEFSSLTSNLENASEKNDSVKLRINWCFDNFVVHLKSISHENISNGTKNHFLLSDSDTRYFDIYNKTGENDYEFVGTVNFLDIYCALIFDKLPSYVKTKRKTTIKAFGKYDELQSFSAPTKPKRLYMGLKNRLRYADNHLLTKN